MYTYSFFYQIFRACFLFLFTLLVSMISGCNEETIILASPEISIVDSKIKALTKYEISVKIDIGEGQKMEKAELIMEDITVKSEDDIIKEIQLTGDQSQEHIITIETNRLSHDYLLQARLLTDRYTYYSGEIILRSLKNNFFIQIQEDDLYSDPTEKIVLFRNAGQNIPFTVNYLNNYNPNSIEVKLNGEIKIDCNINFSSSSYGNDFITAYGNAFLPQNLSSEKYKLSVFIDNLEFKSEKYIKILDGKWKTINQNYSGEERGKYAWFVVGDNLYLVGGSFYVTSLTYSPVWCYNITTKEWIHKKNFPHSINLNDSNNGSRTEILPFSIQSNNHGFVLVRYDQQIELWQYNQQQDNWNKISTYPGKGDINMTCFMLMNKLYLGGGMDNEFIQYGLKIQNELWSFDFGTQTWDRKIDLPFNPISGNTIACTLKNKAFVLQPNRIFWEYDGEADHWVTIEKFPGPWRFSAQMITDGTDIYLIGGEGEALSLGGYFIRAYNDCWKYSPSEKIWKLQAFLPYYSSNGISFLYDEKIITGLGYLIDVSYKWNDDGQVLYEFTP